MSVEGTPRDLHPIIRDDVYRIAREALRNSYRHAQASHIEAEVTYGVREVRLRIRDDGKGIDPQHLNAGRAGHWGLTNMRERAQQIGSQLSLWSEVGAGTEVELRIPSSVAYGLPVVAVFSTDSSAVSHPAERWTFVQLGTLGAALAMLGLGGWFVDARLFGRKHIPIPER